MDDGQTQASPLPHILRRKEWGVYFFENLSVHACACVFDNEQDVIFVMTSPQDESSA
jgi:hypothetical protein